MDRLQSPEIMGITRADILLASEIIAAVFHSRRYQIEPGTEVLVKWDGKEVTITIRTPMGVSSVEFAIGEQKEPSAPSTGELSDK